MNQHLLEMFDLAIVVQSLRIPGPLLLESTMARRAQRFDELRSTALNEQPAAYLAFCKAFQISPIASGADLSAPTMFTEQP